MISREISQLILKMSRKMPIISITGPRQSGKTTLSRSCFPDFDYVNLESPEARLAATDDPKAFLRNKNGLIIDEAQIVPEWFSYLQVISDEHGKTGEFILTGSQNFLLSKNISQSLAGRVFVSHLLPLSLRELVRADMFPKDPDESIVNGFYPRLHDKQISPHLFYPSYSQTYLERDITGLINAQNMNAFRKFMELLAGRTGQLINLSALSIEVGVDHKTIQAWCSILEAGFIIFFLRPYHKNFSKRLIKSPKVYFNDTGLACSLLGIESAESLSNHWARGALFENMIIADVVKNYFNTGRIPPVSFWRDSRGLEIDLIIEEADKLKAVEIKSGTTLNAGLFGGLEKFQQIATTPLTKYLVYGGDTASRLKGSHVLPWFQTGKLMDTP